MGFYLTCPKLGKNVIKLEFSWTFTFLQHRPQQCLTPDKTFLPKSKENTTQFFCVWIRKGCAATNTLLLSHVYLGVWC